MDLTLIFQDKYRFGDLALFESIALASTQVEGLRTALSTAIVSALGEAKTRILRDVLAMYPCWVRGEAFLPCRKEANPS